MPTPAHRDRLGELLAHGAQLIEVLPAHEYEEEHLTGAMNIPLKRLTPDAVGPLDRGRPIVVYCWDSL